MSPNILPKHTRGRTKQYQQAIQNFRRKQMKKSLLVLLSLGLITAMAMPAAAVEFKIGGTWYMQGFYMDNYSLLDKNTQYPNDPSWNNTGAPNGGSGANAPNTNRTNNRGAVAMYTHKLTLRPMVQIAEGLSFHMQMDALEGVMGDPTWTNGTQTNQRTSNLTSSRSSIGGNGALVQENFEFEQAFVKFKTGIGQFTAGYFYPTMDYFGTTFLQQPFTRSAISLTNTFGPLSLSADIVKMREYRNRSFYGGQSGTNAVTNLTGSYNTAASNGVANDSDGDLYGIYAVYKMKPGEVGVAYEYWRDTITKINPAYAQATNPSFSTNGPVIIAAAGSAALTNGYVTQLNRINPYTKLRFGPLYVEAEGFYSFGNLKKYEALSSAQAAAFNAAGVTPPSDVTLSAFGAYAKAQVDFKPFYGGLKFIYKSGDDMKSADKSTGSVAYLYADDYGSPAAETLILFNTDYADPMGFAYGNAVRYPQMRYIDNIWFYQAFIGVNPTDKLNINLRIAYMQADKKPKSGYGEVGAAKDVFGNAIAGGIKEYVSDKIGTEIDLVASYKLFDNLTYTVGGGYLFTGDYFKGFDQDAKTKDNYLLMHKLTLNF